MFFQDVTICAACAPPGGGRNPVTPRMVRHFTMLSIPPPSEHSLKHMFTVRIILAYLNKACLADADYSIIYVFFL